MLCYATILTNVKTFPAMATLVSMFVILVHVWCTISLHQQILSLIIKNYSYSVHDKSKLLFSYIVGALPLVINIAFGVL